MVRYEQDAIHFLEASPHKQLQCNTRKAGRLKLVEVKE